MEVFQLIAGEGPLVGAAIHSGHFVREDIRESLCISEQERFREEDPFTDALVEWAPTRILGRRSRYEVDLNRPRDEAIYLSPDQCWGASIWREPPSPRMIARSLASYDLFYSSVEALLRSLVQQHGQVIVLDVHSYNHRRDGPQGVPADASTHPEVNVGTGTMNRARWAPVVDGFIDELRRANYRGRRLDVRENVRFRGGNFSRWIHATFPEGVCSLAVEFKKLFMDEWTGEVDRTELSELQNTLKSTAPRLLQILAELQHGPSSKR